MGARRLAARSGAILVLLVMLLSGCSAGSEGSPPANSDSKSTSGTASTPETPTGPVVVTSGTTTLSFDEGTFPSGVTPEIQPLAVSGSEFIETFGLQTPGGELAATSVTAAAQPNGEVEISFQLDPSSVPAGATPAIFYLEEESGLWLPIASEYDSDGTLLGTTDHFTDYAAALLDGLEAVEGGAQWLRFQIARGVGARGGEAVCTGSRPTWLRQLKAEDGLNAPLRVCAGGAGAELTLGLVNNRAYSLILDAPTPPAQASYQASVSGDDLVYSAIAQGEVLRFGDDVLAPARMQANLTWPRGTIGPGEVVINGSITPATLTLDGFVAGAGSLVGLVSEPVELLADAGTCLQSALDAASAPGSDVVGSLAAATSDCLEPMGLAAGGAQGAGMKLVKALEVSLLMGRGAQTLLDASAALNESHSVVLSIAAEVQSPPSGAILLSSIRTGWNGAGPTGNAVDVFIGDDRAPLSSTQWVGCDQAPAFGDFRLTGQTRLTGVLAKRDFTDDAIEARVDVLVDGSPIASYEVANDPIAVDLALPAGASTLRLQAIRTSGTCGSASEGYLVWGNGAVS